MASKLTVLMVDDDEGQALLVKKNLRRTELDAEFSYVDRGQRALDFLFRKNEFENREKSEHTVILLDINMPGMDGFEVLRQIRMSEKTSNTPVVMLTTTDEEQEIERSYSLGCNAYITKPVDYEEFSSSMRRLGDFLSMLKLPASA